MREMAESLARGASATRSCAEVTRRLEARSVVSSTLTLLYHHRNTLAALAPSLHPRGVRFSISLVVSLDLALRSLSTWLAAGYLEPSRAWTPSARSAATRLCRESACNVEGSCRLWKM